MAESLRSSHGRGVWSGRRGSSLRVSRVLRLRWGRRHGWGAETRLERLERLPHDLESAAHAVLRGTVDAEPGVPGVVAVATDRTGNLYAGAAGRRSLAAPEPMTTDTVFAIFSATKPITGTACLQLVED